MKRFSSFALIAFSALGVAVANAQTTPAIYPGGPFQCFSPSGKYAVSDAGDHNPMTIIDFSSDKDYSYTDYCSGGSGNYISDTGTVVGYQIMGSKETASFWKNGQWHTLYCPGNPALSYANGITPDGSRIVGNFSPSDYAGGYEGTMIVPCYWDMEADGSYGEPVMLPHPNVDLTGRAPQYITAVAVSSDGKTIAGQLKDYLGMVCQPIIYQQDENGQWSFTMLLEDLFYPAGYELPEFPGDGPTPQQFMTPEESAKYEMALQLWFENGEDDYSTYPDIYDYMDGEELALFWESFYAWQEAYEAFDEALWSLISIVPNFSQNNVYLTPDAKYYASTDAKMFRDEANDINFYEYVPYIINVETGEYKKYPAVDDVNIMLSSICEDGTLLGNWRDEDYGIYNGYILPMGNSEFIPLYDYVKEKDAATARWMEENMRHTFTYYDPVDFTPTEMEVIATGIPFSTPDMSLIGFAQYSFWDYDDPYQLYGYLISLPAIAGIESVSFAPEMNISAIGNGQLKIAGECESLEIHTLGGMIVFSIGATQGVIDTNLAKGLYLVRIKDASGNIHSRKIIIN